MAGWLILETSGRSRVGVARDGVLLASADLAGGRQNNRLLLPTVGELLTRHGIAPKSLSGVAVGVGPGSYTGLRVGLTAAKTLAYAVGCSLVAVPTFQAVAADVPGTVDVIADALQGMIYVQRFTDGVPVNDLRIEPFDEWASALGNQRGTSHPTSTHEGEVVGTEGSGGRGVLSKISPPPASTSGLSDLPLKGGGVQVAGPGVVPFAAKLPVPASPVTEPSVAAVLRVALTLPPLTLEGMMKVEPLYLRGSSAEEKAKRAG